MKRSSTVIWQGAAKQGSGRVTSQSKAIDKAPYAYGSRYEDKKGTNPEELMAAAHASCFTMKLSFMLKESGFTSDTIETTSTVYLEDNTITRSHLEVKAKVHAITPEKFDEIAERAKNECPVSRALNLEITMDASLVNEYSPDESFIV